MLPKIVLLSTGGTIAGLPAKGLGYQAGLLPAKQLLDSVPQLADWADVVVETHSDVGSQDVDQALWNSLARRVRDVSGDGNVDGIVITHGTDTLEETAYFLHLTTPGNKPVVITGAMRPSHVLGADGPANLQAAFAVAASPKARALGVVAVMNDTLHDAVEIQKIRAEGIEAFASRNRGPIGRLQGRSLSVYPGCEQGNTAQKARFADCGLQSWPVVHILYAYAGIDPAYVDAVLATRPNGLVVAGVGNGNAPQWMWQRLQQAASGGMAVVRATRTPGGCVHPGVEVDDTKLGFLAAGGLSAQKARVLLMCALLQDPNPEHVKAHFEGI